MDTESKSFIADSFIPAILLTALAASCLLFLPLYLSSPPA